MRYQPLPDGIWTTKAVDRESMIRWRIEGAKDEPEYSDPSRPLSAMPVNHDCVDAGQSEVTDRR
jgi:hypothetical protein